MSLMSLDPVSLAGAELPLVTVLSAQGGAICFLRSHVVFRPPGSRCDAAVWPRPGASG